jgi:hypothetical protein
MAPASVKQTQYLFISDRSSQSLGILAGALLIRVKS